MFLNLVLHNNSFVGGKSQKQEDIPHQVYWGVRMLMVQKGVFGEVELVVY
jgi:hypothetical protein